MRRAAKIDVNQNEIIKALERAGVSVEVIREPVDLLICHRGVTSCMEVKNPDGRDRITKQQAEFMARWPGKLSIVRSPAEAIKAVFGDLADVPRETAEAS